MKILFFGYWGANEGLSRATIIPHLEILASFPQVDEVHYVSIERRRENTHQRYSSNKITHTPFSSYLKNRFLSKLIDFIFLPFFLKNLIRREAIELLMCRSSLAGSIGYMVHRLTGVPFTVESFEPHADYMLELGIWKKRGISYQVQKFLEGKQKEKAHYILPVSFHYKKKLIEDGLNPEKILVIPCAVDVKLFAFSLEDRNQIRNELRIDQRTIVGIYVGKFGDIYWDHEAFKVFKSAFDFFENFFLIILSPHDRAFINFRCNQFEIPLERVYFKLAQHFEVPKFLSASDFAFSTVKPSPHRKYCSPIKNGEYLANGLPIVIPSSIGDDSTIIAENNCGVIISDHKVNWEKLETDRNNNLHIKNVASKFRSFDLTRSAYLSVLNEKKN